MSQEESSIPTKQRISLKMPSDDLSRSVVGFIAALIAGALIPRTIGYLLRRILVRSFREVFLLAAAGWLADLIASAISSSSDSNSSSQDTPSL